MKATTTVTFSRVHTERLQHVVGPDDSVLQTPARPRHLQQGSVSDLDPFPFPIW